jgi:subtilisin family serine protease
LELPGGPDGFDPTGTIYSALPGGDYGIWEGTSMSTAFVSGGVALVLSQLSGAPRGEALIDTVECRLTSTVEPSDPAFPDLLGAGVLNVGNAANMLLGDVDLDGTVGIVDFLALLAAWGAADGALACTVDLNGDGDVGIQDMLILLFNWS